MTDNLEEVAEILVDHEVVHALGIALHRRIVELVDLVDRGAGLHVVLKGGVHTGNLDVRLGADDVELLDDRGRDICGKRGYAEVAG